MASAFFVGSNKIEPLNSMLTSSSLRSSMVESGSNRARRAMTDAAAIGHTVSLAPKEAVAFLRSKGFAITDNWFDVWQEAQAKAFTIAKMARFDLLSDTRKIIDRKLAEGLTLAEAAREMETAMRKAGWWGRQMRADADGNAEVVRLGSPHRIKTILRTNTLTAYNAGRHRRQKKNAEDMPYWRYIAVQDASTRASHQALHGQVFRHDDPVWDSIYPPNGFNCRCRVQALSERQLKRRGLAVISDTKVKAIKQEAGVDKRTGEVIFKPGARVTWKDRDGGIRLFQPDPGWSYNPGKHALPPPNPRNARAVSGQPTWQDYNLPARLAPARAPKILPRASTQAAALAAVHSALGLSAKTQRRYIDTPVDKVLIEKDKLPHLVEKFDEHRERFANRILPTLQKPNEVWLAYYDNGQFRKHYIKVWDDRKDVLSIVTETRDGALLYNVIPRKGSNTRRVGVLLYQQER